ncbi:MULTISPECIES: nuclear transport factor 2 family protein [Colwelliaceae]|uniref:nuclear transport factor 2 family protein n=1 Tax=Colwelliaceae TaxID=267889 RepID=UPI0009712CE9|nr:MULTISPECIES: nuclear transport factor 2 family protein [Colwelliaceae]
MSDITENLLNDINTPDWLVQFQAVYQNLSKDDLNALTLVYHENIVFEDPLHKVEGLHNLLAYFENLYTHVISCTFEINHFIHTFDEAAIYWEMHYQHPKLKSGKTISVMGHSHLKTLDNKIIYHRDYLDAGAMLYENIPFLGGVIGFLKKRINK